MKTCVGSVDLVSCGKTMSAAACACARSRLSMDTAVILAVSIFAPISSLRLWYWRA